LAAENGGKTMFEADQRAKKRQGTMKVDRRDDWFPGQ